MKITILGNPSVGKTSLRRSYIGEKFQTNYIETIGSDFSFKSVTIDDTKIGLALWDIAGQKKFLNVHPLFYKGSYGCVVVYSVTDRESFDDIKLWIDRFIEGSNRSELPIMIIGNKIDLMEEVDGSISKIEHSERVQVLSKEYSDHKVTGIRTSALTGENVKEGFNGFSRDIMAWIKLRSQISEMYDEYQDDIDRNIPGVYALVMNQIVGPQIVATVPKITINSPDYLELNNSAIKLIASLDFADISTQSAVVSSFPWIKPKGLFHYIAFVINNPNARGKNELFVIGINIARDLSEPVTGIKGVLDGFLYNIINKFTRLYLEHKLDLVTKTFDIEAHHEFVKELEIILDKLRRDTDESLKRWYNIPN